MRGIARRPVVLALACALASAAGCAAAPPAAPPPTTTAPAATATATAAAPTLSERGEAAGTYASLRAGTTGIVVRDRRTGAVWRNAEADRPFRAASTVKLAIAVDLLTRARAGSIRLSAADRASMRAMIVSSDNAAASRLWDRFGGAAIGARFAAYGMTGATGTGAWGTVRCTPLDLERLVTHVLERTDPADRAVLVGLLRAVVPQQRWGVLGVDAGARPGAKNGWTVSAGWAVDTAGFAGPDERWTVVVMTDLSGAATGAPDDFLYGVQTVTGVVTTLFLGLS
jgi:hypothetical protein